MSDNLISHFGRPNSRKSGIKTQSVSAFSGVLLHLRDGLFLGMCVDTAPRQGALCTWRADLHADLRIGAGPVSSLPRHYFCRAAPGIA